MSEMTEQKRREWWIQFGKYGDCTSEVDYGSEEYRLREDFPGEDFYMLYSTIPKSNGVHVAEVKPGEIVISRERLREAIEKSHQWGDRGGQYLDAEALELELFGEEK